jgi:hypothetical protein
MLPFGQHDNALQCIALIAMSYDVMLNGVKHLDE